MNKLQIALLSNGIFSATSGTLLIALAEYFTSLFDLTTSLTFYLIGTGLFVFATTVIIEVRRQRLVHTLLIIVQDLIWVAGSWTLLLIRPFGISTSGHQIILYVSLMVLFFSIMQSYALSAQDNTETKGIKRITYDRVVKANQSRTWEVVSDVGNYHKYALLDSVSILSGTKTGMRRQCEHGKKSWQETCTIWDEGEKYVFDVDTDSPDYPYPFKKLQGTFEVSAIDANYSKISLTFDFEFTRKFPYHLLHPLMKVGFLRSTKKLMDNWQKEIELNAK